MSKKAINNFPIIINNLSFDTEGGVSILKNISLSLKPERYGLIGKNGSGKTTLIKLLTGELTPTDGNISLGIDRFAYLDQHTAILKKDRTIIQNLQQISGFKEDLARNWLALFLFKENEVFKYTEVLSGGERMRAALACVLAGDTPPQLLVLDEPTNNLDIDSIEQIESALLNFRGCLIVISHDKDFLENIKTNLKIIL